MKPRTGCWRTDAVCISDKNGEMGLQVWLEGYRENRKQESTQLFQKVLLRGPEAWVIAEGGYESNDDFFKD